MSLLSSRSTIKAIILAACVSDSLLQTSVASSANLCSVIKVAALLLAEFIATGPSEEIPNNLHSIIIICGGVNRSLRG